MIKNEETRELYRPIFTLYSVSFLCQETECTDMLCAFKFFFLNVFLFGNIRVDFKMDQGLYIICHGIARGGFLSQ